jgi:hypothetical protein
MVVDSNAPTLLNAMKQVQNIYAQRGFRIITAVMDGQFEPLRGDLAGINIGLQTAGHDDHVPEIERYIRTIKERARAIHNTLSFQKMPSRMIIEMVYYCNFWLNAFPHPDGISPTLSPRNIVTGHHIDFNKHCRIEFGAYAQVHEDHDNSMDPRTVGAIALRPTGNVYGNLNTGRLLNRSRWTELPMPSDVITRIHKMSRRGRQGLEFLNRTGQPFVYPEAAAAHDDSDDDSSDDESFHPADDDDDNGNDDPNIGPDIAGVYDQAGYDAADNYNLDPDDQNHNQPTFDDGYPSLQEPLHYPNVAHIPPAVQQPQMTGVDEDLATEAEMMAEDDNQPAGMPIPYADNNHDGLAGVYQVPPDDDDADPAPDIAAEMEERYGPRTGRYDLRPRKPRQYSHLHTVISGLRRSCSCGENKINTTARKPRNYGHMSTAALEHTVMTQHGLKKGLKEFGEAGVEAVLKELQQLHN